MSPEHRADLLDGANTVDQDRLRYEERVHELATTEMVVRRAGEIVKVLLPIPGGFREAQDT